MGKEVGTPLKKSGFRRNEMMFVAQSITVNEYSFNSLLNDENK